VSIDIQPRAAIDIEVAADCYRRSGPRSLARFLDRLGRALRLLELFPQLAAPYHPPDPRFPGLREYAVPSCGGYVVYYHPTSDGITVVRVLDGSMNVRAIFGPP
jgi:plasmid stabilization system protein ParE